MKTKSRIKFKALATTEEVEAILAELAKDTASLQRSEADMNLSLTKIRQAFEPRMTALQQAIKENTAQLAAYASEHPELFAKKKSAEFTHGTFGFRTGTPKLVLLNRKWSWEKALLTACKILPNFIRQKAELDKEQILAQRDELAEHLHLVGLKVTQDESFFVEPKLETVEAK